MQQCTPVHSLPMVGNRQVYSPLDGIKNQILIFLRNIKNKSIASNTSYKRQNRNDQNLIFVKKKTWKI